jgi:hypothetical protein
MPYRGTEVSGTDSQLQARDCESLEDVNQAIRLFSPAILQTTRGVFALGSVVFSLFSISGRSCPTTLPFSW